MGYTMEVPLLGLWKWLEKRWGISPRWRKRPFPAVTVVISYDAIYALALRRVLLDHGIDYRKVDVDGMPKLSRTAIARLVGIYPRSKCLKNCPPMPLHQWIEHKGFNKHPKGSEILLRLQKIHWEAIELAAKIWDDLGRHKDLARQHGRAWEDLSRGGADVSVQGRGTGDRPEALPEREGDAQDRA
jgi:hypothetical protein